MVEDSLHQYHSYLRPIRCLLLFIGLWPEKWGLFQRVLIITNLFLCGIMFCLIMNFSQHHINNLNLFIRGMSIGATFLAAFLKIMCLMVWRKNVVEIHETLGNYFEKDLACETMRSVILMHLNTFKRPSNYFMVIMLTAVVLYSPTIFIIYQWIRGAHSVKYSLIFPARYPWTVTEGGISYTFHYIFEMWALIFGTTAITAVDTLFGVYVFQMCGILCGMAHRMANLTHEDDYKNIIRECGLRHQALERCRVKLQQIYGPIVVNILLTTSIIICTSIFDACTSENMTARRLVSIVTYIMAKILQTLMYAWFGSILTMHSEYFREAVYASGWPDVNNKSFATDILIIMMQRPLVLTACSLAPISVEMVVGVSNTALSYFFLLRTLDEKD